MKSAFSVKGLRGSQGLAAAGGSAAAVRFVEILLVIILGVLVARVFLSLFAPLPLPHGDVTARAPGLGQSNGDFVAKSPFPATVLEASPVEIAPAVAETTLDLTLTGVWTETEEGSALIRTPDGKESRFAVGDTIVSGVTLEAVFPNEVAINRNGVREALRFETKTAIADTPPEMIEPRGRQDPNAPLKSVTSASIGDMASILRPAPAMNSEGQLVIELYASRNRAAFAALGLKDGDRLVSVNGKKTPIDPTALSSIISQIPRADTTQIVVERGGEEIPLTISLRELGIE